MRERARFRKPLWPKCTSLTSDKGIDRVVSRRMTNATRGKTRNRSRPLKGRLRAADLPKHVTAVNPLYERVLQHVEGVLVASCALPYAQYPPAHCHQFFHSLAVAYHIALKLGYPKLGPSSRHLCVPTRGVGVPKASMNEDRDLPTRHDNVWRARQVATVKSKSESGREQQASNQQLWP